MSDMDDTTEYDFMCQQINQKRSTVGALNVNILQLKEEIRKLEHEIRVWELKRNEFWRV